MFGGGELGKGRGGTREARNAGETREARNAGETREGQIDQQRFFFIAGGFEKHPTMPKKEELDESKLTKKLQNIADKLNRFMQSHVQQVQSLDNESALKKAGLKREYNALAKIVDDVNKRLETVNAGGKVRVSYI